MPHNRMLIHEAVCGLNDAINKDEFRAAAAAAENVDGVETLLPQAAQDCLERVRPEIRDVMLGVVKRASEGDRSVYFTWRHGPVQSVEITVPEADDLPVDIALSSRYTEDGLAPS